MDLVKPLRLFVNHLREGAQHRRIYLVTIGHTQAPDVWGRYGDDPDASHSNSAAPVYKGSG